MKGLINRIAGSGAKYWRPVSNKSYIRPFYRSFSSTAESSGLSIKATPEYAQIPYNTENDKFLFMTTLSAPLIDTQNRSAIDLVCVLDGTLFLYISHFTIEHFPQINHQNLDQCKGILLTWSKTQ